MVYRLQVCPANSNLTKQDIAPAYYGGSAQGEADQAFNDNNISYFFEHPIIFAKFSTLVSLGLGSWQFLITLLYGTGGHAHQIALGSNGKLAHRAEYNNSWTDWIIEVKASDLPTTSWGNVTVNTDIVSNATIQYQKYGNICILYFAGNVSTTDMWTDYKLASGFPLVKYGYIPMGIFQHQDTQKAYITTVNQTGELYLRTENTPPSGWMRGSITYICN